MMMFSHEDHKIPEFKEVKSKDWILFGHDNVYPDYLIKLYERSAKHSAIINGKVDYILGDGWEGDPEFIAHPNRKESLNEVAEKTCLDFELFNGMSLEVIWSMDKSTFEIFHFPFNQVRTNEHESIYFTSDDWRKGKQDDKTNFKEWKPFTGKAPEEGEPFKQLFVFNIKSPAVSGQVNVYPIPDYIGANAAIETDIEIANFHLSNVKTGFWAGTIVNFNNGMPTDEKKKEIDRKLKEKFTGTDKAGTVVVMFNDGKDRAATIERIPAGDLDKQFDILEKRTQQEIFTGHKVTSPMLFGVKTEGQLGGTSEFQEAFEIFQNTYVQSRRRMKELVFNRLAKASGKGDVKIKRIQAPGATVDEPTIPDAQVQQKHSLVPSNEEVEGLMEVFKEFGEEKKDYHIHKSNRVFFESHEGAEMAEEEMRYEFQEELKALERSIIDLLDKDPLIPNTELAEALSVRIRQIDLAVGRLTSRGLLAITEVQSGDPDAPEGLTEPVPKRLPTKEAKDLIKTEEVATKEIEVRYSYEVDKRFGAPIIPGTRDFCRNLLGLDRLYTRNEIETISGRVSRNVWLFRGGWKTNPTTGVHTPFCRHIWMQNIVTRK